MNKVCLFGASGHGKVIKEVVESQGSKVVAFVDDNPKTSNILNTPVLKTGEAEEFLNESFIISIGNNLIRKKISKDFEVKYTTAIDHSALISSNSSLGEGTVVMAGTVINTGARVGKHCVINTKSVIEHDCIIEDYVHVSPNSTITGNVKIGEGTHVGAGAVIIPNIKIGKWVTIGAGAVIIEDIPDYVVVVGNPARIIKYKNQKDEK